MAATNDEVIVIKLVSRTEIGLSRGQFRAGLKTHLFKQAYSL